MFYLQTKCPNSTYPTIYDEWQHYNKIPGTRPLWVQQADSTIICVDNQFLFISYSILNLGASSDYTAFLQNLGITSSDFSYTVRISPLCSFVIEPAVAKRLFLKELDLWTTGCCLLSIL